MKRIVTYTILHFIFCIGAYSQSYVVSGYVYDSTSTNPVYNVYVINPENSTGVITNESGYFSYESKTSLLRLDFSYVGFKSRSITFNLKRDTIIKVVLSPIEIKEVVVFGNTEPLFKQTLLGKINIPIKEIEAIPSFIGEPDIMKAITFKPGISSGQEGRSNIFVRGGDRDQNLILLDGIKIYNTNHLGGYLSAFNGDIVESVDIYKGGFPARFGGRLSSVIDIKTRDGSFDKVSGKYSVGVLQSSFLLEGPLASEKTSFIVALRGSYLDILTLPIRIRYNKDRYNNMFGYSFYDINSKISHKFPNRSKLSLSIYAASDLMASKERGRTTFMKDAMQLNTRSAQLELSSPMGNKFFARTKIIYSGYSNNYQQISNANGVKEDFDLFQENLSTIRELSASEIVSYYHNSSTTLRAGIDFGVFFFSPSIYKYKFTDRIASTYIDTLIGKTYNLYAKEANAFIELDKDLTSKINFNAGVRFTAYTSGAYRYFTGEPRLSVRAMLLSGLSAKISYTRMSQGNHCLVSNYEGFEKEVWVPGSLQTPFQFSSQYAIGLFGEIKKVKMEFGLELFYKELSGLSHFISTTQVLNYYSDLAKYLHLGGTGTSKGMEVSLKYTGDKLTIESAYTLSKSTRTFESINNGQAFPSNYHKTHDFSSTLRYKLTKRTVLNTGFVYSSGVPFTFPESYSPEGIFFDGYYNYSGINNVRLPAYHRLDVGLERHGITRKGNKNILYLNIYNAYARKNPVYIYKREDTGKVYQKSLFSILPTISYSVKF